MMLRQEVMMLKDVMLEMNGSLIQEMKMMNEVMHKSNDKFISQMQLMRGCVIVLVIVLAMVIVKL